MSDPDDDRRPIPADGQHDEHRGDAAADAAAGDQQGQRDGDQYGGGHDGGEQHDGGHDGGGHDGGEQRDVARYDERPDAEPPVEPGSDESVPADRPAVDPADAPSGVSAAERVDDGAHDAGQHDAAPDEVAAADPDFGSIEQQAGDDSLAAPGTPPRTIDIDDPTADETRPNPMADAPDVVESTDARDDQPTAAYDRLPAEAAAPPLVEPAPPEPTRAMPIGPYDPLDEPTPAPSRQDEPVADDAQTARYPAAAPLPPVGAPVVPPTAAPATEHQDSLHSYFPEDAQDGTTAAVPSGPLTREEILDRQKESFSGFKFGSAFFGAIVTTGVFVILSAIVGAVVVGLGLRSGRPMTASNGDLSVEAIVGASIVAVVLFLASMAGAYVTGRMARFAGVKQGLATWFWGILFAVLAGLYGWYLGADRTGSFMGRGTTGADMDLGRQLDGGAWWVGVVAIVVVLAVTLLGAIAGGALGMRYHRRVDRAGFEPLV
ncbi:hypothetical protein [Curtobacterium sp. RRHDQ10]|uniref:hypothetical protein n=1 Tax=Curtobacterium phyllosphaerae TaxID=3413379 RepID=UPI003BEFBD57